MNEHNHQHSYENGSTRPPKSHGGLIAAVLCISILLLGIFSAVSILNHGIGNFQTESGNVLFSEIVSPGTSSSQTSIPVPAVPTPDIQIPLELHPVPGTVDNIPQAGGLGLQEIYAKNIPSVVSITCTLDNGATSGTGVVLSEQGYLVTNAHVVADALSIQVLLTDGRTLSAAVVGTDRLSDLAVLYVDATDLTPGEFGDSAQIRVGDAVVAIGDPLGVEFRGTMTDGIVSAINRNVQTGGRNMTLIQTNAALNSGNSGGPLINCFGQIIGINTLKIGMFTDDAGVEGLGFAIPSATVKQIVDQLIAQGYVSGRPTLGLDGQWVSSFHQQFRGIPAGLYITDPQEASDIRAKDILLSLDGVRVTNQEELDAVLYAHEVGDRVTLVLYRDGRQYSVELTLQEAGK